MATTSSFSCGIVIRSSRSSEKFSDDAVPEREVERRGRELAAEELLEALEGEAAESVTRFITLERQRAAEDLFYQRVERMDVIHLVAGLLPLDEILFREGAVRTPDGPQVPVDRDHLVLRGAFFREGVAPPREQGQIRPLDACDGIGDAVGEAQDFRIATQLVVLDARAQEIEAHALDLDVVFLLLVALVRSNLLIDEPLKRPRTMNHRVLSSTRGPVWTGGLRRPSRAWTWTREDAPGASRFQDRKACAGVPPRSREVIRGCAPPASTRLLPGRAVAATGTAIGTALPDERTDRARITAGTARGTGAARCARGAIATSRQPGIGCG